MEKDKIDIVFVTLVYRNDADIPAFVKNVREKTGEYSCKIVVVNSYYDEESEARIKNTALSNGCDFFSVPNKGFGAGNNRGIEYANEHYDYDYVVVCNSDVEIREFAFDALDRNRECVIAPTLKTAGGKSQNPYWSKFSKVNSKLLYKGFKKNSRFNLFFGFGFNKLNRELFLFKFRHSKKQQAYVYAAHGSFAIYPRAVLEKMGTLYDENMFLYSEEAYVARKLQEANIATVLVKDIFVKHFEDGCTTGDVQVNKHERESYLYYYENFIMKKKEVEKKES